MNNIISLWRYHYPLRAKPIVYILLLHSILACSPLRSGSYTPEVMRAIEYEDSNGDYIQDIEYWETYWDEQYGYDEECIMMSRSDPAPASKKAKKVSVDTLQQKKQ